MPTVAQVDAILAFLDRFSAPDFVPGELKISKGTSPWYDYAPEVNDFEQALYDNGWVIPFDWNAWSDTANEYVESAEKLDSADIDIIQKLFTTHVRAERFITGHLGGMFEEGHIVALLKRLKRLREEM